jgi:hypothetical protein
MLLDWVMSTIAVRKLRKWIGKLSWDLPNAELRQSSPGSTVRPPRRLTVTVYYGSTDHHWAGDDDGIA